MLLTAWLANHQPNERGSGHRGTYQQNSEGGAPQIIPAHSVAEPLNPGLERDEWREEQDLQAQRDMVELSKWMLAVNSVGVFVTFVGLIYVVRAYRLNAEATNAATEAARETKRSVDAAMDAERAWILFDAAALANHLEPARRLLSAHPSATINLKNLGKSPAWMRRVQCRLVALSREEVLPANPQYPQMHDLERTQAISPGSVFAEPTNELTSSWDGAQVEAAMWGRLRLVIYGFVEYEDIFGRLHETQFCYHWRLTQYYGTFAERSATAVLMVVGGSAYNYQT